MAGRSHRLSTLARAIAATLRCELRRRGDCDSRYREKARLQPGWRRARAGAIESGLASAEWYHSDVPRKTMKELMQRSDAPGDPRHDHLDRRRCFSRRPAASASGARGGACRSFSSMACSTALRATRAGTNAATARRSRRGWMNDVVYQIASFMVMRNPVTWRWSHARHHTDTIIVGRDAEIAVMRPPDLLRTALEFRRPRRFLGFADRAAPKRVRRV